MKTIAILLLSLLCQYGFSQTALPKTVTLEVEDQRVDMVLKMLKDKYQMRFAYSRNRLSLSEKVSILADNMPLEDFLVKILRPAKIQHKIVGTQIILKNGNFPVTRLEPPKPRPIPATNRFTQTIKGIIQDSDSKQPLFGATVWMTVNDEVVGATTDANGKFKLDHIPVGRHAIQVSFVGYKAKKVENILLISGKENDLVVELDELATELKAIIIHAHPDLSRPINEMNLADARSFSVEEISRYAGSIQDPARLMTNYAGVTLGSTDPVNNSVSVRGNSPTSNLWRLEGVDIPNPNHYSTLGSNGGAISMLSTSTLTRSDFLLGGYPADYGNALGGIFDLKLRTGNTDKTEFAFAASTLGIETSLEGPFEKYPNSSYLVNYRFSSLFIFDRIGIDPTSRDETQPPFFQDLSFKIQMPTKDKGTFRLFGLGGLNNAIRNPLSIDYNPKDTVVLSGRTEKGQLGIVGLNHQYPFAGGGFLSSTFAFSHFRYIDDNSIFLSTPNETDSPQVSIFPTLYEKIYNNTATGSTIYTKKADSRNTFRLGMTYNHRFFNYVFQDPSLNPNAPPDSTTSLSADGYANFIQFQLQWKHKFNNDISLNAGLHAVYYDINENFSVEPRLSMLWAFHPRHRLTLNVSNHSKLLHEAYYLISGQDSDGNPVSGNPNLDVINAWHFGLGWKMQLGEHTELKTEGYYQYIYNVPVSQSNISVLTQVNSSSVWNLIGPQDWINLGTSQNYGLECTLEKRFARQWYLLNSFSLFESRFSNDRITQNSTRFNQQYSLNIAGGKEFTFGSNNKNIFGINARFIFEGGLPYTPIDLDASIQAGRTIFDIQNPFSERLDSNKRLDISSQLQINKDKVTHTIQLDIQNATFQRTQRDIFFNPLTNGIEVEEGLSIVPVLLYRIAF